MKDIADRDLPSYDDMLAARTRIEPHVHRAPVPTSRILNEMTGADLHLKCETFREAGAFEVRGACNAVFGPSDVQAARGVATRSSGDPAPSPSHAAGRRGIPCHVVMPRTAPQAGLDAGRGCGGIIAECVP